MGLKAIIAALFYISKFSVQALALLVVAQRRYRRAKTAFRKSLILWGVDPGAARELAEAYPNPVGEVLRVSGVRGARGRDWRTQDSV